MSIYRRLLSYLPTSRSLLWGSVFCSVLSGVLLIVGYWLVSNVLADLLLDKVVDHAVSEAYGAVFFLVAGGLTYYLAGLFSHKVGFRLEKVLRQKGAQGLGEANFRFFDQEASGTIRKTLDDNASMTHSAVAHMIPDFGQAAVIPVGAVLLSFMLGWPWGLAYSALVILALSIFAWMMAGETDFIDTYQQALQRLSGESVEYIRGMAVVKVFNADLKSFQSLYQTIQAYCNNAYAYSRICKVPYVTYQWLFYGALALVTLGLVALWPSMDKGPGIVRSLVMFALLAALLYVAFMRIMYTSQHFVNARFALDNLEAIFSRMHDAKLSFGDIAEVTRFDIAFESVTFGYHDKPIFKDFSLTLEEGKIYALVGASASGKSTLMKLMSGFYGLDGGCIRLGGHPLTAYQEEAITRAISSVYQDCQLFKTTLYENVALARPGATRAAVMKALADAQCLDILEKFPLREMTVYGADGVYLSGGEKQRIAVARALLKEARILLLDEASASLDIDNELKLMQALKTLMRGKTVMMIAHRLSSIREVDEILVLKAGELVERGSHEELIALGGEYASLVRKSQLANTWSLDHAANL